VSFRRAGAEATRYRLREHGPGGESAIGASRSTVAIAQPEGATEIARLYANLNRPDSAFLWLDRAYERRAAALWRLKWDSAWKPIRSDPRFQELLKKVGLVG